MKRQQAFIDAKKMLKGGLHCHTTRSDGRGDPADVIRLHKQNGYDFLALTDHRKYNYQNFAPDTDITIIPGMEFDNPFRPDGVLRHFHTVCIGPEKADGNGYEQDETMPSGTAKDQFEFQKYLDEIHAKKNLTFYCHPEWSSTSARWFEKMQGHFAMEVWNSGCAIEDDQDTDAAYWDEILGQGICLYGVATDDGHPMYQHCNGWVRVNAENNVRAILDALAAGKFYSSCGPEIYDFYVDDNKAVIDCSAVAKVRLHCAGHPTRIVRDAAGNLTHAEFTLDKHWCGPYPYVRMTVIDKDGKHAWTNPIFLD